MLTFTELDLIETITQNKCAAGNLFTAYDVTTEIRNLGIPIRHYDVKPEVYKYMNQQSSYTTAPLNVSGNTANVFFNPSTSQVSDYLNNPPFVGSVSLQGNTGTLKWHNSTSVNGVTSNTLITDSKNRVRLGARTLREVGLKPGERAYLVINNKGVTVSSTDSCYVHKTYTIDKYTNLRIALPADYQANSYTVDVDAVAKTIRLEPA